MMVRILGLHCVIPVLLIATRGAHVTERVTMWITPWSLLPLVSALPS